MENKIYIISLSPAIDYILKFDDLKKDKTNRPFETQMYAAGKGIHISMLLDNLQMKNESIIFTNGEFEDFFYNDLDKVNLNYHKFKSEGNIRINLKLIDNSQTECSIKSPTVNSKEIEKLKNYLKNNIHENDYVVLTGSIPAEMSNSIYAEIANVCGQLKAKTIIDAFGEALDLALSEKPFLIKPNVDELSLTAKMVIKNDDDVIEAAKKLLIKGAQNILVSMGKKGALFINKETCIHSEIGNWDKKLVNAAGAGDSMLAGFIYEYIHTSNFEKALIKGIVCGSATAYSDKIASKELIDELEKSANLKLIKK